MEQFYQPFLDQNKFMDELITNKNEISIGTLGPSGTSSERALHYMTDIYRKKNIHCKFNMILRDSFTVIYEELLNRKIDYALVPTAYEKVSAFYWCPDFINRLSFIYKTPYYGIVGKKGIQIKNKQIVSLATCPAADSIFEHLMKDRLCNINISVVHTNSTIEALTLLIEGKVDICVTNQSSFEHFPEHDIHFISPKYRCDIVWTLFGLNKREGEIWE